MDTHITEGVLRFTVKTCGTLNAVLFYDRSSGFQASGYLTLALSVGTLLTAGFLLPDLDDASAT